MKALLEQKNSLLDKLEQLVEDAKTERRAFTSDENKLVEDIKAEIRALEDELQGIDTKREKGLQEEEKMEFRTMKDAVLAGEKLEKRTYEDNKNYDFGKLVCAMAGKESRSDEATFYRSMSTANNKVVVPQKLADQILDMARSQSAIWGRIPTILMPNNNMKIAKVTKDAEANFVKEGELIPESEMTFTSVDLEGKTLAAIIPVTEQLLDSTNIGEQLMISVSRAIAEALDRELVYGLGHDPGEEHCIKGIAGYDNIHLLEHTVVNNTVDYDPVIKSLTPIKASNLVPTDIVYNSTIAGELSLYKTGDGQYIPAPILLSQYNITESNNLSDQHILTFNRDSLLLGIHKDIQLEFGYMNNGFQSMTKALRVYVRCDLAVLREDGITLTTIRQ